jgi:pimeloyl-ACP methyl ester carboxylesterase
MVAQELTKRLGQQVVVDNRPGAGATIGSEAVAKSPPDGYTLLLASQTNAIIATPYPKLAFAPIDDFAPISLIGREPGVLVAHPSLPVKTVQELIELARGKPGELDYACKKLPEFMKSRRRPIDRAFVRSIFERDHPDCADASTVEAFADAILALDSSMPNGTYIDMCANLPVVDPLKITVPTIVMRGQFDGIAGIGDLLAFFEKLPNPDKQFTVMSGISHASFQQKNYLLAYHVLHGFFTHPQLVYTAASH